MSVGIWIGLAVILVGVLAIWQSWRVAAQAEKVLDEKSVGTTDEYLKLLVYNSFLMRRDWIFSVGVVLLLLGGHLVWINF